ncbi:CHRD domain-containing protein [Piscinibacter sp.]|uniref:CHRD domain-containing protein n=1 Tax=Piscinibacter sp. TaxID=1903157 RepID=UPI002C290FE5|nr:CHRD domain-containing protein [Albitalea sp.]HUG23217.1 CHRD domain-containing protein [Albitalea sp.]
MKPSVLIAGCLLAATALPAAAITTVYTTQLSGLNEAPPNASPGTGMARVTVDTDAMTMRVEASFADLMADVTAAHIHCCTAVPNVPPAAPATPVPSFPGFPAGVMFGAYDMTFDMSLEASYNPGFIAGNGGTAASAFGALVAGLNAEMSYFNIHTTAVPSGEISGFLQVIPEPETYALMLAGLGLVGWAARRRR